MANPNGNPQNLKRDAGPGRPKGSVSIVTLMKRYLQQNNAEKAEELMEAWYKQALENPASLKMVLDRIDGPVTQVITVGAPESLDEIDRELSEITDAARARESASALSQEAGVDEIPGT
jgi:hypothetical protein